VRLTVEQAIEADNQLTDEQRHALLGVYRSYLELNAASGGGTGRSRSQARRGRRSGG
jgi:hypothetical protein